MTAPTGGHAQPHAAVADLLTDLHERFRDARHARKLTLRDAAGQVGLGFNTLSRFERGFDIRLRSAIRVLRWLDEPGTSA